MNDFIGKKVLAPVYQYISIEKDGKPTKRWRKVARVKGRVVSVKKSRGMTTYLVQPLEGDGTISARRTSLEIVIDTPTSKD